MHVQLHKLARTTPAPRRYIQQSPRSSTALAQELGGHPSTVRKWKRRTDTHDRSHCRHHLLASTTAVEERLLVELRTTVGLSLDDLTEVIRRCVNPSRSRSAIHRCLRRHGVASHPLKRTALPVPFQDTSCGFIHLDLKYLSPLHRDRTYAFVAIDRATRYVYLEIHDNRRGRTAAEFLHRFVAHFPHPVHTILTDNGSEWTDRFAVEKKDKLFDRPSGQHPIDRFCATHGITHKLTRPFCPRTNGMVERFNRRLTEQLEAAPKQAGAHRRFPDHQTRNAYIHRFVSNYNRTRLRCLGYHAPLEVLGDHAKPYKDSVRQDYPSVRILGKVTPKIQTSPAGERLLEYESKVSLLLREHPMTAVCQYDSRSFDGATIMDVLKVHPWVVVRGSVVNNPFFVPPEEFLSTLPSHG